MSDEKQPPDDTTAEDGTDSGSGDPNDDRSFLMHQPPAQVKDDEQDE